MAENLTGGTENFLKAHPYASAGIVLGVVLVVWWLVSRGSSAPQAGSGVVDDTGTADAAAIQAAQIGANGQLAQAQIQAGVLNNQTAAASQVALAQIGGQTATAQFNSAAEIATSNSAVAIAASQIQGDEQLSNNATLASEYADLSSVLNGMFNSTSNTVGGGAGGTGGIPSFPSATQDATSANWFTRLTASQTTPLVNPNVAVNNAGFLTGFGGLVAGLGVGLQTPQTASLSPTQILSLAQINMGAANSSFNA